MKTAERRGDSVQAPRVRRRKPRATDFVVRGVVDDLLARVDEMANRRGFIAQEYAANSPECRRQTLGYPRHVTIMVKW